MKKFHNEINIKGSNTEILKFFSDKSCVPYADPEFVCHKDIIYVTFISQESECRNWLHLVKSKYPELEFKLFYRDINDGLSCGFVDLDGIEHKIPSSDDFKLACKLLKEYK